MKSLKNFLPIKLRQKLFLELGDLGHREWLPVCEFSEYEGAIGVFGNYFVLDLLGTYLQVHVLNDAAHKRFLFRVLRT